MGLTASCGACLRFWFGRTTTAADLDTALDALAQVLPRLRAAAGRAS
jgi:cysteine sulfinate desulfinase/cysteine desulfurase-like protein